MGFRTDVRLPGTQLYSLTSGSATNVILSVTGTSIYSFQIVDLAYTQEVAQTAAYNVGVAIGANTVWLMRHPAAAAGYGFRQEFYPPIEVPAGSSFSAQVSSSGAHTINISMRYLLGGDSL